MQRVIFAVVEPGVIEVFDTEIRLLVDDDRVSTPQVSLPMQLTLPLEWLDDDFFEPEEIDHENEEELCAN